MRGVTLELSRGLSLILGPNGSGKTTFLKLVVGMLRPSGGRITVLGRDPWRHRSYLSSKVSFMFEGSPIPWWLSGREFLLELVRLRGEEGRRMLEVVRALGIDDYWDRHALTYSSGMRKRVLIASALGFNADLYVLDEPFSLLDSSSIEVVSELVLDLVESGKNVLVASHHFPRKLLEEADAQVLLNNGRVEYVSYSLPRS